MTRKSNPNFILGISDKSIVKLDFDKVPFNVVKYWSSRACFFFKLEEFIISKSSWKSYHVVFNRSVSWDRNVHVMSWVARLSGIESVQNYVLMQGIKESSTLRIGPKGVEPFPRIVHRFGRQDDQVRKYFKKRRVIKKIVLKLRICPLLFDYSCADLNLHL